MKARMRDGSGYRHYRYLIEDTDRHGVTRIYLRRKGQPKIPIKAQPGTPEFDAEYQRAFNGAPSPTKARTGPAAAGSVRWLFEQYYSSSAFKTLGDTTRHVRRGILEKLSERIGHLPYRLMEPRDVARLRDEKSDTPDAANNMVKALRHVFKWACSPEVQLAEKNPGRDVTQLQSKRIGGHRPWQREHVEAYEAHHPLGTKARLALDLIIYTGVRRSDVVRLGPQMEKDGLLIFTEYKGRNQKPKHHRLPILPPLRASIDATPIGHLVYLATAYGQPRTDKGFGAWFRDRCREAGLPADLSAHGVRKFAAIRCAERGATAHQLMALFGWLTLQQAQHYTAQANRAHLEAEAAALLDDTGNKSVQLLPSVRAGWTDRAKR